MFGMAAFFEARALKREALALILSVRVAGAVDPASAQRAREIRIILDSLNEWQREGASDYWDSVAYEGCSY